MLGACDILSNQEPRQSLPLKDLYNSTDGLENALTGAYNDAQSGNAMGSSIPLFGDLMADNTSWSGSFEQWQQIASHRMNFGNSQVEAVWNQTYQVINDANLIIEAVDKGNINDPDFSKKKDQIKGEALFIRAMMHFEAVRFWAKPWGYTSDNSHVGVPLITKGTDSPTKFTNGTRATVAEVYQQVISDLQQSINLLSGYTAGNAGRANQWNVRAYLARVYAQQHNYSKVLSLTQEIMNSNQYSLEGAPQNYFFTPAEETSSEAVLDIVNTDQDNPGVNNSLSTFYAPTDVGGRGDIQVTTDYMNALAAATPPSQENSLPPGYTFEDLRNTQLIDQQNQATLKYNDGTNTADNAAIIRYPGVLLLRAEALAETASGYPSSQSNEAIDLLNKVHLRSIRVYNANGGPQDASQYFSYNSSDFSSNADLLDAIHLERRAELAFEGERKHDLVRWGMDVPSGTSSDVAAPDANQLIWPIPQGELDANPDIQQNPGYGGGS